MQRTLVQLKSSLFMTVTVMDNVTSIIQTWQLSRFALSTCIHQLPVVHFCVISF